MKYKIYWIVAALFIVACDSENKPSDTNDEKVEVKKEKTEAEKFIQAIERAHQKDTFNGKSAIQFDLALAFGGKTRFAGTITMSPNGDRIKMQDSSMTMIWDGKKATIAPDTANEKGARFALFTWSYFFAAPYKLSDPGTNMEHLGRKMLNDKKFEAGKLTFGENVGDTPDDWYIVYKDTESDLLTGMAYIVTAGETSQEEAEKDPHAITYEAYVDIEGIPFATVWNFWSWNEKGELSKLLGNATLSNIRFINMNEDLFKTKQETKPL